MDMKILVVDDEEAVRESLRRALQLEGYDVELASDGAEALDLLAAEPAQPDAIVLDVLMPRLDGLEVARELRREGNSVPILMLTARAAVDDRVAGLDAGADDYLVKPFSLQVLAAHLRAVLRRREPSPEVLRVADLELDTGSHDASRGERRFALTSTEYRLLLHLMREAGQVIPKAALTRRVWGYDFEGNENVCEVYVGYLRQKLEAGGEPRLIHTLRGAGYTLRDAS